MFIENLTYKTALQYIGRHVTIERDTGKLLIVGKKKKHHKEFYVGLDCGRGKQVADSLHHFNEYKLSGPIDSKVIWQCTDRGMIVHGRKNKPNSS